MVAVPSPTGPSKVGTRVVDLVDSTRDDPFLAEGIKRELLVRFWYPTSAGQDCNLADYTGCRLPLIFPMPKLGNLVGTLDAAKAARACKGFALRFI